MGGKRYLRMIKEGENGIKDCEDRQSENAYY